MGGLQKAGKAETHSLGLLTVVKWDMGTLKGSKKIQQAVNVFNAWRIGLLDERNF